MFALLVVSPCFSCIQWFALPPFLHSIASLCFLHFLQYVLSSLVMPFILSLLISGKFPCPNCFFLYHCFLWLLLKCEASVPAYFSCCLCQAQIELKIQTSHRIGGSLTERDQAGRKGLRVYGLQVTVQDSRFKL